MNEFTDDDVAPVFANAALQAPPLPREVHARVFIEYDGKTHLRYPGGEIFAKLDDMNMGTVDDLVEVRNPLDRAVRVSMHVGLSRTRQFNVRCERHLIPAEYRCSESLMMRILSRPMAPLRIGYLFVYVELAPGETTKILREWLKAWRLVKDGVVQSGQFPQVEVIGEQDPPELHSALREEVPMRSLAQGARRRKP